MALEIFPGISNEDILSEFNFTDDLSIYANLTLDYFTENYVLIVSNFILPIISIINLLSNLAMFGLLISLRLNNRVYNYLILKSFLVVLISASHIPMGNAACLHCKWRASGTGHRRSTSLDHRCLGRRCTCTFPRRTERPHLRRLPAPAPARRCLR